MVEPNQGNAHTSQHNICWLNDQTLVDECKGIGFIGSNLDFRALCGLKFKQEGRGGGSYTTQEKRPQKVVKI
jgi:hypothetical protein